jgi:hypothetical protein
MYKFLPFIFLFTVHFHAQELSRCERAIQKGDFHILDRQFKQQVRKHRKGTLFQNGSSSYTIHSANIKNLVDWLANVKGEEEVVTDDCMAKISIFPGWTSFIVRLNTQQGIVDRIYTVQKGKVLNRPLKSLIFRKGYERNDLIFKGARNDSTFFSIAKFECLKNQYYDSSKFIPLAIFNQQWKSKNSNEAFSFQKDSTLELYHLTYNNETFHFSYPGKENTIRGFGTNNDAICFLTFNSDNLLLEIYIFKMNMPILKANFFIEQVFE